MAQDDPTELFRAQPDTPPAAPSDEGVHSWPFGSYAPMAFYRPTPIVHFTGTLVSQVLLNFLLYALLVDVPGAATVAACALVALIVAGRARSRWLGAAALAWKVATLAAIGLNLLFMAFVSLARDCSEAPRAAVAAGSGPRCAPSLAAILAGAEARPR